MLPRSSIDIIKAEIAQTIAYISRKAFRSYSTYLSIVTRKVKSRNIRRKKKDFVMSVVVDNSIMTMLSGLITSFVSRCTIKLVTLCQTNSWSSMFQMSLKYFVGPSLSSYIPSKQSGYRRVTNMIMMRLLR